MRYQFVPLVMLWRRPALTLVACTWTLEDAATSIPADYLAHLILQMVVITFNFTIYICTGETGAVYKILLYCPDTVLNDMRRYMATNAARVFAWAHEYGSIPPFVSDEDSFVLSSRNPSLESRTKSRHTTRTIVTI